MPRHFAKLASTGGHHCQAQVKADQRVPEWPSTYECLQWWAAVCRARRMLCLQVEASHMTNANPLCCSPGAAPPPPAPLSCELARRSTLQCVTAFQGLCNDLPLWTFCGALLHVCMGQLASAWLGCPRCCTHTSLLSPLPCCSPHPPSLPMCGAAALVRLNNNGVFGGVQGRLEVWYNGQVSLCLPDMA